MLPIIEFLGKTYENHNWLNVTYSQSPESPMPTIGSSNNVIKVSGFSSLVESGDGDDRVSASGRTTLIKLGNGNNRATVNGSFATVSAGTGDDIIAAFGDVVNIDAGSGCNQIYGSGSVITMITTGDGDDFIYVENATRVTIKAGNGNNTIQLGKNITANTTLVGGTGDDIFSLGLSTSATLSIEGYGKNDKILLADLAGVTVKQVDQNVQILRGTKLEATVIDAKASDINLSVGSTQAVPDRLRDPFSATIPIATFANTGLQ